MAQPLIPGGKSHVLNNESGTQWDVPHVRSFPMNELTLYKVCLLR